MKQEDKEETNKTSLFLYMQRKYGHRERMIFEELMPLKCGSGK